MIGKIRTGETHVIRSIAPESTDTQGRCAYEVDGIMMYSDEIRKATVQEADRYRWWEERGRKGIWHLKEGDLIRDVFGNFFPIIMTMNRPCISYTRDSRRLAPLSIKELMDGNYQVVSLVENREDYQL